MPATPTPLRRSRLISYWWAPLTLVAVALAVVAYLHPYQPLSLDDVTPQVVEGSAALDKAFGKPADKAYKYATRRTYSSAKGPIEVEIRVKLQPLGNGLVMRDDDWFDIHGRTVVYQERYILFRNLFAVHSRNREVAPLMRDLMGRVGWYDDTVVSFTSTQDGTPNTPGWKMDLVMERMSDTDGQGLTLKTTRYQRRQHCERAGELDGAAVGAAFKGSYARISCTSVSSDQPTAERKSDYVWLPEQGLFLLLGYRQQKPADPLTPGSVDTLDVKGNYVSFEAAEL